MDQASLFAAALGLTPPWQVVDVSFSTQEKRLDIIIDFPPGSSFACPVCGALAGAYDTKEESWRHLNFFQYAAYLRARVPRVQCPEGCGIKKVSAPWTRPGSGFTLLFEALVMTLAREMPVAAIASLFGEHDTRIWRVIQHYVEATRATLDFSGVSSLSIDETASRRGHNYISLFFNPDEKRLLFATEGRDAETVKAFTDDLTAHDGEPEKITSACIDMSPAFIKGVQESLSNAHITFDRFHLMKLLNEAVDEVRRSEAKSHQDLLKKTRYVWLKNPCKLSTNQKQTLACLSSLNLKTARAYQIRLNFQEFYSQVNRSAGELFLKCWYFWATHSRLEPIKKVAKTIKEHWNGILNWFDSRLTTGFLEGINSLIQAAKARARGYRSTRNLINMAYLIAGKLNFKLPT